VEYQTQFSNRRSRRDWHGSGDPPHNGRKNRRPLSASDLVALYVLAGDVAVKIHAPAANGSAEFLVESNSAKMLFVGSAIKTFIVCDALRQVDSANVVQTLTAQRLPLDASVWRSECNSDLPNFQADASPPTSLVSYCQKQGPVPYRRNEFRSECENHLCSCGALPHPQCT
jgi:hypothetical protein